MTIEQMEKLKSLYRGGLTCGEVGLELGLKPPIVDWALWLRELPSEQVVQILSDMEAKVVPPYGRNGLQYLSAIGIKAKAV